MKNINFKLTITLLVIIPLNAISQMRGDFVNNTQVNEYVNALFVYTAVAKSCGHINTFNKLKPRLIQLLSIANKRNSLTKDGKNLSNNLTQYISRGGDEFKRKPYITCGEANKYYKPLIASIDPLIKANK
tara:strand:- start:163 stop:552 length:390 start_codon:yes stop_codon:yes gene_type:complete